MSAFLPSYEGQLVTNCHQLQSGSRSVSQPVTNCHQLKIPAAAGKQGLTGVVNANGVAISQPRVGPSAGLPWVTAPIAPQPQRGCIRLISAFSVSAFQLFPQ